MSSLASLFSMPIPLAGKTAAVETAPRVGKDGALELQLPASAFGEESYGGKPRLPRPPAYGSVKAGFRAPGR